MVEVVYEIVPHNGGWAYRSGGVYSETFATREHARQAAERAAAEQELPGSGRRIVYQDEQGNWHEEQASGDDRPQTRVNDRNSA